MELRFGGIAYPTEVKMAEAIAIEWMTAGGRNPREWQRDWFARNSDAQLAAVVLQAWELSIDPEVLAAGFGKHRAKLCPSPERQAWNDRYVARMISRDVDGNYARRLAEDEDDADILATAPEAAADLAIKDFDR